MNYTEPTLRQRAEVLTAYGESERLVREAEHKQITSVSNTTWWRLSRKGQVLVAVRSAALDATSVMLTKFFLVSISVSNVIQLLTIIA